MASLDFAMAPGWTDGLFHVSDMDCRPLPPIAIMAIHRATQHESYVNQSHQNGKNARRLGFGKRGKATLRLLDNDDALHVRDVLEAMYGDVFAFQAVSLVV